MVFNSYTFVIFLAGVLLLHSLPISWRLKKLQLLIASYVFYAAWNPPFVLLLWFSTVVDWFAAKRIARAQSAGTKRAFLWLSLASNLGLLAVFKYGHFLLENTINLLASVGITYQPPAIDIVLPVGISFYTFQTLSYTIDVYRKRRQPDDSFLDFALYVTFFPQLVAGPIVRSDQFLPQCKVPTVPTWHDLSWGGSLLVLGLFEKVVLADGLFAPISDAVFASQRTPDMLSAWCAGAAFAGQVFCDFAGYSTCAIGVAMCLGFYLPINFRFPYAAVGFGDFWQRWHISLSTWLRDYVYFSFAGSRTKWVRSNINAMLTMLLCGLWHGASWMFVFWGGLHGVFIVIERWLRRRFGHVAVWRGMPGQVVLAQLTFLVWCFSLVYFRSTTFRQAFTISGAMLGMSGPHARRLIDDVAITEVAVVIAGILCLHWHLRETSLLEVARSCPWWIQSVVLAAMLVAITTMSGEDRAFIYFQF